MKFRARFWYWAYRVADRQGSATLRRARHWQRRSTYWLCNAYDAGWPDETADGEGRR